jgi:hypothetical protein
LSQPVGSDRYEEYREKFGPDYIFRVFNKDGLPLYEDYVPGTKLDDGMSILPFFPGYTYVNGVSTYLDEVISEGGRAYSVPGIYYDVWDGDIASQHPHSIIMEMLFGPVYTKRFNEIVDARVAVKHKDFETAGKLLGGALKPFLNDESYKDLAQALKIVINSIYGLTAAKFSNAFRDERNVDNIVAKRGALFMTLLKSEVEKRNFKVAHIKTDSIKIPTATNYIRDFVIKFGREYGYEFETEAEFESFCLLNKSVYAGSIRHKDDEGVDWVITGKPLIIPYVTKTLFTKEELTFDDMCETIAVNQGALYIDMNEKLPDVSGLEKELDKAREKYKKGKLSDITYDEICKDLEPKIAAGHAYQFVGKVGQFCPMLPGAGGGTLYRYDDGKYYAAAGTTGYRFMESELVKKLGLEDKIDLSYYDDICDSVKKDMEPFGGYDHLMYDRPLPF